jgi:GMP synthase-like glutamine amidotransferase
LSVPRVLIVNNGSLSIPALRQRFEELGAMADVERVVDLPAKMPGKYQALVLSGTRIPAHNGDYGNVTRLFMDSAIPTLGVCGGMHIIAVAHGATLAHGPQRVGNHRVELKTEEPLFASVGPAVSLFQRHTHYLQHAPDGFETIGWSPECPIEFVRSADSRLIGSQAHLEFRSDGRSIIQGFISLFR